MNLSQKQSDAWHYLEDNVTKEVLYGGSAGGGKSKLGCVWHIYRRTKYPNSRGLIGRSKLSNLKDSTLVTLFETCRQMGYTSPGHYTYNAQSNKIHWKNGSTTILKDLFLYPSDPDFASLGSTEFTDAFIDECTEVTLKAKEIVSSRIRWKLNEFGLTPKLLMTCNPSPGWVKDNYIVNDKGTIILPETKVFINAKVYDNPDKDFVKLYISQLEDLNDYDKQRLLNGDWDAMPSVQNPFAHHYDSITHTMLKTPLYEGKQLTLSIDFNLNPFSIIAAFLWSDKEGEHCHILDEFEIYKGSIPAMIDEIKLRYGGYLHNVQLTGDAMGNRGDLSQRDNANYYIQLKRGLGLRDSQIVVVANPKHSNSREEVNYILKHFPDFKIAENCKQTHFDLKNVQCDAFGSIIKRDRSDLTQRGDFLDVTRYLIHTFLSTWKIRHQKNRR